MKTTVFSHEDLDALSVVARAEPRLRKHRNVHSDYSDPCQRVFNAIEPGSYVRPHRHNDVPREETMVAIRGQLALLVFDGQGGVEDVVRFGVAMPGEEQGRLAAGVVVPPGCWHTVLAERPGSVLFEIKAGPYDPGQPKEFAPWAPDEGSASAAEYVSRLQELARGHGG